MADLEESAARRLRNVSEDALRILDSVQPWSPNGSPRGSEQSSVSLRGLVERLRASNDDKKRHLSELQAEIDQLRPGRGYSAPRAEPERAVRSPQPDRRGRPAQDLGGAVPDVMRSGWGFEDMPRNPMGEPYSPTASERRRSPSPVELPHVDDPRFEAWDATLWATMEAEELGWEQGTPPPLPRVLIEAPDLQICEQKVLELLESYREIMRRLDTYLAGSRMSMIKSVASKSEQYCQQSLEKELANAWGEWQTRELESEQQLLQVNQEIDELRRRIAALELEEKHVFQEVSKQRAVRLVPMQQLSMLQVELNKARTASQQHQSEFEARSREQETKISSAQKAIEQLTRELSSARQRNFDEEARVRETHLRELEVLHMRISELSTYRADVLPIIQEYHALRASESSEAHQKIARLKEIGDRHRRELIDLVHPANSP
jgi:hypothetical protein